MADDGTAEQQLLAGNLRRFLQDRGSFEARCKRLAASPPDRLALWPSLAEMGVVGAAFDEAHGGFGGDPRSVALVQYELGRALAVEPYLACSVVSGRILQQWTDASGRRQAIGELIEGRRIYVPAHDGGGDPFAVPLLAGRVDSGRIVLDGKLAAIRHADVAQEFLVAAALKGETLLLRVPRETPGLQIEAYRLVDGAGAGDLHFHGAGLDAACRLEFSRPAQAVLQDALEWGLLGLVAETLGIAEALNGITYQYLNTRKQFGTALAGFQALQHRCADMHIAAEELSAILELALAAMAEPPSAQRSALVSAAKSAADAAGRRIGHEAIQLHGGMGVSDELNVSHYGRRLAAIRAELGAADLHRLRFGACSHELGELLDLQESAETRAWRDQVREFVRKHLPADLARKGELGLKHEKHDYVGWQKILRRQDWFAAAWPREHGGLGWDLVRQLVFTRETTACNAPWIPPYGVNMVGPVIYTYGSEAQKRQHLPGILDSEVWWCQGYSEPGAGSDLASLKTVAERDGDHYVVSGAKLWTTEAQWADWMHCLVRTSREGKPQSGISFLLIDMRTAGIEIKPILTIDGVHHTNALFLDQVRVPVANRLGEEGQGWAIAKFLLANERVSVADTGPKLRLLKLLRGLHRSATANPRLPEAAKVLLGARLAELSIQLLTLCALERRYVEAWARGAGAGAAASVLKVRGTEILQALSELALELEGPLAAAYDPADLYRPPTAEFSAAQRASLVGYEYLYGRCWSIFGGTNEIQRNLIARQVLGI